MANSNTSPQKVEVNGSTGLTSTVQNDITLALLQNGGFRRIQAILQQRLDEAGWSQDLKDYTTRLLRSGAAKTYDDVFEIISKNIESSGAITTNTADGIPAPNLAIPREASEDGADAVKRELAQIVKPAK